MELKEDDECPLISAYAQSLSTVSTPTEIYGFTVLLLDLCSSFTLKLDEQYLVLQTIIEMLSKDEIEDYNKRKMLQILVIQINENINEDLLNSIVTSLTNVMSRAQLFSEIFLCWSEIIYYFPDFLQIIFLNIAPIAAEHLLNSDSQQSIIYFFQNSISETTFQTFLELMPFLLPSLYTIVSNEIDLFKSDATDLIEKLYSVILLANSNNENNFSSFLTFIQSSNLNNFCALLALCVLYKNGQKVCETDHNFLLQMLVSRIPKERYMAIRCVRVIVRNSDAITLRILIEECLKNIMSEILDIQIEVVRLIGVLGKFAEFPVENFFDVLISNFFGRNPYLGEFSYQTLKKITSFKNTDSLLALVPKINFCFAQCLTDPNLSDYLVNMSTLIQSLAFNLGRNFTPFSEQTYQMLQQMSKIDHYFLVSSFPPIVTVALATGIFPFLSDFCGALLRVLQSSYSDEDTVACVVNSFFHVFKGFDVCEIAPQFVQCYFAIFNETHNLQVISGLSDIFERFPDLFPNYSEKVNELLIAIVTLFAGNDNNNNINSNTNSNPNNDDFENENININNTNNNLDRENELDKYFCDICSLASFALKCTTNEQNTNLCFVIVNYVIQFDLCENTNCIICALSLMCDLLKRVPHMLISFVQNNERIKEIIGLGLNDDDTHTYSQELVSTIGYDNF